MKKILIISAIITLVFAKNTFSQLNIGANSILLPVSAVKVIYGDSCDVIISTDAIQDIKLGPAGKVFGKYTQGKEERNIQLGNAVHKRVYTSEIHSTIGMKYPKETNKRIWPGDLAEVIIDRPLNKERSIIYELASLNIFITDNFAKPFYSLQDILYNDNAEKADSLMKAFLKELINTALMSHASADFPIINEGKFKGISLHNSIIKSTESDLRNFLNYIIDEPLKHLGNKININELYNEWLLNNTPISSKRLEDIIGNASNSEEISKALNITGKSNYLRIVDNWLNKSLIATENKNYNEADKYISLALKVTEALQDTAYTAKVLYQSAKLKSQQNDYAGALLDYQKALEGYNMTNNNKGKAATLNNIGWQYIQLGQYKKAGTELSKAIKIQEKIINTEMKDAVIVRQTLALSQRNNGLTLHLMGKSKKSLSFFNDALASLSDDPSETAAKRRAMIYNNLSEVYNKLGNKEKAEEAAAKAAGISLPDNGEEF